MIENAHRREEERMYIKFNNINWLNDKKWKVSKIKYEKKNEQIYRDYPEELLTTVIPQMYKM